MQPASHFGRSALGVFLVLAGIYLATASFRIDTIDTGVRLEVARSLVREGTPAVEPMRMQTPFGIVGSFPGQGGRHFAVYGIGQSLLMVPFVALGGEHDATLIPIINLLATALTAAMLVLLAGRLGFSERAGVRVALLYGVATLAWPHAKFTFEAPLESAAGVAALFFALREGRRSAVLAGLAFGAALLVRPTAVLFLPALAWLIATGPHGRGRAGAFALAAAPAVAVVLGYNALRWGDALSVGYDRTEFRYFAPQARAFFGLVASPGRSFFVYNPALVLAFSGFRGFRRAAPRFAPVIPLIAGAYLAFLSFVTVWSGDWTWGPRHLLPVVPVLALAPLPLLEPGRIRRSLLLPLVSLSIAVQLVGVSLNYETYYIWYNQWVRQTGATETADDIHFAPSRSQVYVESRLAWTFFRSLRERMIAYEPSRDGAPYAPILQGSPRVTRRMPDFWWVWFPLVGVSRVAMFAFGLLCVASAAAGMLLLRERRVRGP